MLLLIDIIAVLILVGIAIVILSAWIFAIMKAGPHERFHLIFIGCFCSGIAATLWLLMHRLP